MAMIVIGFFFLGMFRFQSAQAHLEQNQPRDGETLTIQGEVIDIPERTNKATKFVIEDENKAKFLVVVRPFFDVAFGDVLKIQGNVKSSRNLPNQNSLEAERIVGEFIFPETQKLAISPSLTPKKALYLLRNNLERMVLRIFPEPEGSFASGLLLGVRSTLPESLNENLKKTSTTHLIALSGFNISIIVEALRMLLSRRSARLAFWAPLIAILFFVIMTGASPSIVRAGIMGGILVLARRVGRQSSAATAIIITAALMIVANPFILRFDLGFQLSFLAFIGIIYLSPPVARLFRTLPKSLGELLALTLAAQIMVYPFLIHYFGTFSIVSPIVNLIILPFIPLAMLLSFVPVVFGFFWLQLGQVISWAGLLLLKSLIEVINFFGQLQFASLSNLKLESFHALFVYVIIFEIIFLNNYLKRRRIGSSSQAQARL